MTRRTGSFRAAAAASTLSLAMLAALSAVSALPALSGCTAGVKQASPPATAKSEPVPVESGFLTDYSKLAPSEQFPELRFWRDESRKTGYRRLRFRPVEVWRSADRILTEVPDEDLQFLADSFYQAVRAKLAQSFEIVDESAPGVLEIHLALTLVSNAESNVDFFSTAVPAKDLAARHGALGPATMQFVRDCALEAEMFESDLSKAPGRGKRVPRIVRAGIFDVRRGSQTPKGDVSTWEDVRAVFDRWGAVLDERLVALRDGTFKPRLTTKAQRQ